MTTAEVLARAVDRGRLSALDPQRMPAAWVVSSGPYVGSVELSTLEGLVGILGDYEAFGYLAVASGVDVRLVGALYEALQTSMVELRAEAAGRGREEDEDVPADGDRAGHGAA